MNEAPLAPFFIFQLITEGFIENIKVLSPTITSEYRQLFVKKTLRRKLKPSKGNELVFSFSSNLNRKNLGKAKESVFHLGVDYKLVRVGNHIMEGDIFFHGVSYETMKGLYNASDVLLSPYLYEGFG